MAQLTEGELQVMQILWEHGELKPAQIQKYFPTPIKNPALRSYLAILVEKGHASRHKVGKAFYYKPKTRRETAMQSMLKRLVGSFWNGSTEGLLCHLIKSQKLTEKELLKLKELAEEAPAARAAEKQEQVKD